MEAWLHVRLWPTEGEVGVDAVEEALDAAIPLLDALSWSGEPFGAGQPEDVGFVFSQALNPSAPEDLIRDVRQTLGFAKHLAVRRPDWWVEVWDDLQLVEGTFGRMLSLLGGAVVDRDTGAPDADGERTLADHLAKVDLGDLDLGMPPGVDPRVTRALAGEPTSDDLAAIVIDAADTAEALGYRAASRRIAGLLDATDPEALRPRVVDRFETHAPAVRAHLGRILRALPKDEALDTGLGILFDTPRGLALNDAAAALEAWAEDPDLVAALADVVLEDVPPQPGTRLEGAAADLLLRTRAGARAVARRAARDRDAEPYAWWAVRKLLESPRPETLPTILLYARGPRVPTWLAERVATLDPRADTTTDALRTEEDAFLAGTA